jgi:1,4-dihydroxy-2-naphthoyl-CoA hydrolase
VASTSKADDERQVAESSEPVGFMKLLGMSMLSMSEAEVVAELQVIPAHHQPMGIVHGGVYCALVETVCSIGAYLHASKHGLTVVGVDNQTSFLRATRTGVLRVSGKPLSVGRRTQLWQAEIHNAGEVLVATGRVRLMCIEPETRLGGEPAKR